MIKAAFVAVAALALSGCMSLSRSSTITALPAGDAGHVKVTEIRLTVADAVKVSASATSVPWVTEPAPAPVKGSARATAAWVVLTKPRHRRCAWAPPR